MSSGHSREGMDARKANWGKFVERANIVIDSKELARSQIDFKLRIGRRIEIARNAVIYNADDWANLVRAGLDSTLITSGTQTKIRDWIEKSPDDASRAFRAIWTIDNLPISERIRSFGDLLPDSVIQGSGTRTRLMSVLLMGLDVTEYPPFATKTLRKAFRQAGYGPFNRNADEAELYEHALSFLDLFLEEAQAHGARLCHRLDAQSIVWHWQGLQEDLPELGLPFPENTNKLESENDIDDWKVFIKRATEYINSAEFQKKHIVPLLKTGSKLSEARTAALDDYDDWADLVKSRLAGAPVFNSDRLRFLEWIDGSPDDAMEALQAIWMKEDLHIEQRIRAFCERFPKDILSGTGTRMTVAAALLMALDAEQYTPFSIDKLRHACLRTGYSPPDHSADEAALYTHSLRLLDQLIEESRTHGLKISHRLEAFSVVWHGVDVLPRLSSQQTKFESIKALADELHLSTEFLEEICILLDEKLQIIFQGPPGTGKTFVARELAKHLSDPSGRVTFVQFHPSYAYEDFVRGFRPKITESGQSGFSLQDGPLLRAAKMAREEQGAKHFLLIDEINRGNLAKVFGELYFLLEYRDDRIHMQYQEDSEDDFSLPENLYIIGTMNTADRSIALVDMALRRRFYFVEFHPDENPVKSVLRMWLEHNKLENMTWVADVVDEVNELLKDDRHAAIGPSYFMKEGLDEEDVRRIWKHSVVPYIEERLFGIDISLEAFDLDKLKGQVFQRLAQKESQYQTDENEGSSFEE